jgi:hypothetical protein
MLPVFRIGPNLGDSLSGSADKFFTWRESIPIVFYR